MSGTDRAGLSLTRLEKIGRHLQRNYVDPGLLPGSLTQVWRKGELAYSGMNGSIDMERSKPMREDAIFRIYSMSKPITAVALMMLVEEGRISLADDVETYIPSWKGLRVYERGALGDFRTTPTKRPMRVIDLCTHTAGLTYGNADRGQVERAYKELGVAAKTTEGGLESFVEQLAGLPLTFSPGDAWNYSVAMDVMGYLVQKVSGQSFGEFLRTRIFEPLGMTDTAFWCPPEKLDRFASCYEAKPDGACPFRTTPGRAPTPRRPSSSRAVAGWSPLRADYMRFCRMMLNGGDTRRSTHSRPQIGGHVQHEPSARWPQHGRHDHVGFRHPGRAGRLRLLARLRGEGQRGAIHVAGQQGRIFVERRGLDLFLDRPRGRPRRRLHDAGDGPAVARRHAPSVAGDGLFSPDGRAGLRPGPVQGA